MPILAGWVGSTEEGTFRKSTSGLVVNHDISKIPKRPETPFEQLPHPLPLRNVALWVLDESRFSAFISCSVGVYGAAHCFARLADEALRHKSPGGGGDRKGFPPMSIKRVTALGASFVCNVKTPVTVGMH